jgi:hypothetical protein
MQCGFGWSEQSSAPQGSTLSENCVKQIVTQYRIPRASIISDQPFSGSSRASAPLPPALYGVAPSTINTLAPLRHMTHHTAVCCTPTRTRHQPGREPTVALMWLHAGAATAGFRCYKGASRPQSTRAGTAGGFTAACGLHNARVYVSFAPCGQDGIRTQHLYGVFKPRKGRNVKRLIRTRLRTRWGWEGGC